MSWEQVSLAGAVIAVVVLGLSACAPGLRQLELGDDAARSTGVRAEPVRLAAMTLGVALTAVVTAAAGPISYVALAAPQIGRRLARTPGVTLAPAALTGALLLAGADVVAQHSLPASLPVGVITVVVGGAYLLWLVAARCGGADTGVPDRSFTVIVGPNACGKSTLLRAQSRLLRPSAGSVILDGQDIRSLAAKELARRVGLLPQSSIAPEGITVGDLVARGRFPHQGLIRQWTAHDEQAVLSAMDATGVTPLSGRLIDELSGGQRQRVWVAMALAQETEILLLDEPTTFLDIAHQIELMELFTDLHRSGRTLVAVLHDLNQAARYGTHLIAMKDGAVIAEGPPAEVVNAELVEHVFGLACWVLPDPVSGTPSVVPLGRDRGSRRG